MKLFSYWRSSASYRVRIALHLKGISFETVPVHLLKEGGEQKSIAYSALNPAQLVPTLVTESGLQLNQSLAIIEYLDTLVPNPRLIPQDPESAALVRALSLDLAADLQPITNLRVLQYLTSTLGQADATRQAWIQHWTAHAFSAIERRLAHTAGSYCFGDQVTLADVCLIPQVYNAQRFGVDMQVYPQISAVAGELRKLPAFDQARPELQPDAHS